MTPGTNKITVSPRMKNVPEKKRLVFLFKRQINCEIDDDACDVNESCGGSVREESRKLRLKMEDNGLKG